MDIATSVIVLTRNAPKLAQRCLQSLVACEAALAEAGEVEFIVADDCSDHGHAVAPLFKSFGEQVTHSVRAMRFRQRVHYAHGLAYTLSLARGRNIFFISHDMILTSDCVAELIDVARNNSSIGVVRPTSEHMDWAGRYTFKPSQPPGTLEEAFGIAREVRKSFGGDVVDWPMLIGDAMWISRAVIDRIGVFDTRFYGLWADIDFGVRLHRAGFRHVIARGAWLHHEGNGAARESSTRFEELAEKQQVMLAQTRAAYELFRQKWPVELPENFRDLRRPHFEAMHALPPSADRKEYEPPVAPPAELVEEL